MLELKYTEKYAKNTRKTENTEKKGSLAVKNLVNQTVILVRLLSPK